ncbi:lipoprotein SmpA/OmlA [Acidisphaera rubrifaciens HS-AP3]|uniref:Lipoprotein SmpA/OmlA n=1 Tax=Acidisphaera rubrifaciens HS-AP3 TaxID=1231350 RepID=A0A0D6P5P1_9PROT|nr:lipoprotein SmpA/OmlA [Acidisphaera rubrifaciens HS-AP3]
MQINDAVNPCPARPTSGRRPRAAALLLLVALGGCSFFEARPQVRGNLVDTDTLKELVPGTSTRADATALLGSPTAKATFDDNTWVYIGEVTQPQVGRTQDVVSQEVVLLSFNNAGVLEHVRTLNQDNSYPVEMASGATPSPGSEASLLQQLFGSIGKYNPLGGALGNQPGAPTGGANTNTQ